MDSGLTKPTVSRVEVNWPRHASDVSAACLYRRFAMRMTFEGDADEHRPQREQEETRILMETRLFAALQRRDVYTGRYARLRPDDRQLYLPFIADRN